MQQPQPRAMHIVQHADLYGQRDLKPYRLLVCNASIPADGARASAPEALWFGSFNAQLLGMWGPENPFWNGLRAAMRDYVLRGEDGKLVFSSEHNAVYFDFCSEGVPTYARWIAENCPHHVYLDDFVAELPAHRIADLPVALAAKLCEAFVLWRSALIAELRAVLPADRLVIANTAGLMDPQLNGITIERSHIERLGAAPSLARFATQFTIGREPAHSVDWSGQWELEGLGVHAGEVIR